MKDNRYGSTVLFVPLLVFIAIRGYLQEGWLYATGVVVAGLLLGLILRWRERKGTRGSRGLRD